MTAEWVKKNFADYCIQEPSLDLYQTVARYVMCPMYVSVELLYWILDTRPDFTQRGSVEPEIYFAGIRTLHGDVLSRLSEKQVQEAATYIAHGKRDMAKDIGSTNELQMANIYDDWLCEYFAEYLDPTRIYR